MNTSDLIGPLTALGVFPPSSGGGGDTTLTSMTVGPMQNFFMNSTDATEQELARVNVPSGSFVNTSGTAFATVGPTAAGTDFFFVTGDNTSGTLALGGASPLSFSPLNAGSGTPLAGMQISMVVDGDDIVFKGKGSASLASQIVLQVTVAPTNKVSQPNLADQIALAMRTGGGYPTELPDVTTANVNAVQGDPLQAGASLLGVNKLFQITFVPTADWQFDWGDGVTTDVTYEQVLATLTNLGHYAFHTYAAAGTYTIRSRVKNNIGWSDWVSADPIDIS